MSDLISRKALMDKLENKNTEFETVIEITDDDETKDIIDKTLKAYREILKDMILNQPTVYDVDKVVANLKSHNNSQKVSTVKPFNGQHRYYRAVSVTKAIKIVEGGGMNA